MPRKSQGRPITGVVKGARSRVDNVLKKVGVFCGANSGFRPEHRKAAQALGTLLARKGIKLIFGGARRGLMGALADAALAAGGEVIGVIPQTLADLEIQHTGATDLRVVSSMHERKMRIAEGSDAFIALPGGYGTLEEFFEMVTWSQLGLHRKPCGLLNTGGYYAPLLVVLDNAVREGFLNMEHRALVLDDQDPGRLLDRLARFQVPAFELWDDPLKP